MNQNFDVIVGGGGPVGLFLACELALAGASVLVLERDAEKNPYYVELPLGLRGLNTLSAEAFDRRGLLDDIRSPNGARFGMFGKIAEGRFAGHFAGIMMDARKFDASRWKYRSQASPQGMRTDLARLERALTARARELGVEIVRGCPVTGHSQTDTGVTVYAGNRVFAAQYLVGCDGGRSTIRKDAGFEFVGSAPEFTGYTVLCELDDYAKLKMGPQKTCTGMYFTLEEGHVIIMDFDGGKYDRSQTLTREHFEERLQYVSGTDVRVTNIRFGSTFTDRAMLATTYRKGRVFLAGDSAHIHSPLGGQGLNAGIGDALNLGWKLAAVVRGTAPADLLDTYERERQPIGEWVTDWTRAQVNILQPTPAGEAAYALMKELIDTCDGTNYFVDRVRGLSLRYDLGSDHPLVGASAPDFQFTYGKRLAEKMRNGKGAVIDFTSDKSLKSLATEYGAVVDYINSEPIENYGLNALIVRPDAVVAWLSEAETNIADARNAMQRWFGAAESIGCDLQFALGAALGNS